jgi:hypothetical protein
MLPPCRQASFPRASRTMSTALIWCGRLMHTGMRSILRRAIHQRTGCFFEAHLSRSRSHSARARAAEAKRAGELTKTPRDCRVWVSNDRLVLSATFPLCPRLLTLERTSLFVVKGQDQTHAVQQSLHFVILKRSATMVRFRLLRASWGLRYGHSDCTHSAGAY